MSHLDVVSAFRIGCVKGNVCNICLVMGFQSLLPGDIERDAIEVWLEERQETFDVLKLPHHGKKEKNTKELIESVQPEIAVITDSEEEDASKKVLKGLEEEGAAVYRSSVNGTIVISGNGAEDYQVTTEKQ